MTEALPALKARFIDQDGLTAQQAAVQPMAKALQRVGESETEKVVAFARLPESPVLKLA